MRWVHVDEWIVFSIILWDVYGMRMDWIEEACVPLPLDHFFFCFLAPVAAGAILSDVGGINGSLARRSLAELEEQGQIKKVVSHSKCLVYTRAVGGTD